MAEETQLWRPTEVNDTIEGKIVDEKVGTYGKAQYLIETGSGKFWTCEHNMLIKALNERKIGDKVKIVFGGTKKVESGKRSFKTKQYTVETK